MQNEINQHPSETTDKEYCIEDDPLFQPLSKVKSDKIDKIVKEKLSKMSLDENVDKDSMTIPGQNYALISIVSPDANQKYDKLCLKIKGVFDKIEDARKQAEMLQKIDTTFDVYVVEMYSWLLLPPDPELIEQVHIDEKLNEIIIGHRESQLKSKMHFEERKKELIENISLENEERKEENEKLKKEEEERIKEIDSVDPDNILNATVSAGAGNQFNVSENGENCPNSVSSSTPSELMDSMINNNLSNPRKKTWADKVEEEEQELELVD